MSRTLEIVLYRCRDNNRVIDRFMQGSLLVNPSTESEVAEVLLGLLVALDSAFGSTFDTEASHVSVLCFIWFLTIIICFLFLYLHHLAKPMTFFHPRCFAFYASLLQIGLRSGSFISWAFSTTCQRAVLEGALAIETHTYKLFRLPSKVRSIFLSRVTNPGNLATNHRGRDRQHSDGLIIIYRYTWDNTSITYCVDWFSSLSMT